MWQNSSFKDPDSLVLLSRTLRLVNVVMTLAETNKYLRELWGEHSKTVLTMIRDLLATPARTFSNNLSLCGFQLKRMILIARSTSVPRSICREQALSIIESLPGTLMDENTLSTVSHFFHLLTIRILSVDTLDVPSAHRLLRGQSENGL